MKRLISWLRDQVTPVALICIVVGIVGGWVVTNWTSGPGTIVYSQEEAVGPQFSDPKTLDIVIDFHRLRVCPAVTQRWVWRWTKYEGQVIQQAIPLATTSAPFLADGDRLLLTVPSPDIPDINDRWYYRTVTTERCGFLPQWASALIGARISRSPDQPVTFVGAPHS